MSVQAKTEPLKKSTPCNHFPECGSCNFLDLAETKYRQKKQQNAKLQNYSSQPEWIWISEGSRRRITLQIGKNNELGFFAAKSKNIIEINSCLVAEKEISRLISPIKNFLKTQEQNLFSQAVITLFDNGLDLVFQSKKNLNFNQTQKLLEFAKENNLNISSRVKNKTTPILLIRKNQIFYPNFKINLDSDIFIQATKSGLQNIINIIRETLSSKNNNLSIIDIYAGFGAYSFAIADLAKNIVAIEGSDKMVELIKENTSENNLSQKLTAQSRDLFFNPLSKAELNDFDFAIINPPRNGATPQIKEIAKSKIETAIYVSCNTNSFFNDAKILIDCGFKIARLVALDQFYSTNHLELIAIFEK